MATEETTAAASGDIADTGLDSQLKRVLPLRSLVFLGLAYINLVGALTLYGIVTTGTHGMFALAFVVAFIAMLFTAYSYKQMATAYPIAGSAYSYTTKSIGAHVGFLVGWVILLDYIVLPITNFVLMGLYLNVLVPEVPVWAWTILAIVVVTTLNVLGVRLSANVGGVISLLGVGFLATLLVFIVRWLLTGNGAGTLFSLEGFATLGALQDPSVGMAAVFSAAAVLCLCFLGFDAITTFAEEAVEPRRNIGRAIMITCLVAGSIFVVVAYFTQLAWPDAYRLIVNPDTGATELIELVAGPVMAFLFSVLFITGCFGSGVASMNAGARVLFVMGRDGALPRVLAYVHPTRRTPLVAIAVIAVISFGSLFIDLLGIASIVNFGGLIAFGMVNVSVIAHYFVRSRRRNGPLDVLRYLVVPGIGAAICFAIWFNLAPIAFLIGGAWFVAGVVYLIVQTRGFRRSPIRLGV